MPYASATEGTRVRRRGDLNAVARSRVCKSVMFVFRRAMYLLCGVLTRNAELHMQQFPTPVPALPLSTLQQLRKHATSDAVHPAFGPARSSVVGLLRCGLSGSVRDVCRSRLGPSIGAQCRHCTPYAGFQPKLEEDVQRQHENFMP